MRISRGRERWARRRSPECCSIYYREVRCLISYCSACSGIPTWRVLLFFLSFCVHILITDCFSNCNGEISLYHDTHSTIAHSTRAHVSSINIDNDFARLCASSYLHLFITSVYTMLATNPRMPITCGSLQIRVCQIRFLRGKLMPLLRVRNDGESSSKFS